MKYIALSIKRKNQYLFIAGYVIKILYQPSLRPIYPKRIKDEIGDFYGPYLVDDPPTHIDYTIYINFNENLLYDKRGRCAAYLPLYKEKSSTSLITYYHISIEEFNMVLIRCIASLLYNSAAGFILHCSSVSIATDILIFCGPKRAGKSTISKLLDGSFQRISDDNIIIKKEQGKFVLYQSPLIERNVVRYKSHLPIIKCPHFFLLGKSKSYRVISEQIQERIVTILKLTSINHVYEYGKDNEKKQRNYHMFFQFLTSTHWNKIFFAKNKNKVIELVNNYLFSQKKNDT